MAPRRVLVIAGSDSSGGAGLEADQKVIAAHSCYAMTATTALTAQNTKTVYDVHHVPAEFLKKQIDAVIEDVGVDVVKTGMLASAGTIETIADALEAHNVQTLVVDPVCFLLTPSLPPVDAYYGLPKVMISTTGAQLLPPQALRVLRDRLLPLATILTPNIPEARLLLADAGRRHFPVECADDLEAMAKEMVRALGVKWVLVKGGHCPFRRGDGKVAGDGEGEIVVDVLAGGDNGDEVVRVQTDFCRSRNTHGTGCSLASAIASNLAKGMDVPAAVRAACRYVEAGIKTAPGLGEGNGPLNHFHSVYTLPFSPGHFVEYLLERPDVAPVWDKHVNHPFVLAMGDATLPLESFKGYLIQDYLYLTHFARANALGSYKAKAIEDVAASAAIVTHVFKEMELHIGYCAGFGISRGEMENTEEKEACTAYTRYVLDIGQSEDWLALQIAMAPCLLGYGAIAKRLHADPQSKREGNIYWTWIENYVAEDYVTAVKTGSELLERHAVRQSPARIEELAKIFIHATKMEIAFWEMYSSS
ncbi:putative hydroxymethylpyrimidine/phosphomethylpyrimidine kinase 2 [Madurella mycetomatis]|uniref:Hydroxymethylpyrimidine/phosphomethylpyrimidine kinase 2 n=1 Tax=Madurella mycetomatis TaxID=100816 RepID=A0A175WA38_9PEZI|nr:putative hydroxymethylpyrimidine/phosphomethylpyrimidine kinase 2 [Madurella mycetomatis]